MYQGASYSSSFKQLGLLENATNASSNAVPNSPDGLVATIESFWTFVLYSSAIRDGAKLFIIGVALESGRILLSMVWASFIESFFITAEFEDKDDTFTWIMFWLSRQPKWNKSRNVRISTFRYGQSGVSDQVPGEEEENNNATPLRRLAYTPTHDKTQYMWYRGSWMCVTRSRSQGDMWNRNGDERLTITMLTLNLSKLDALLLEAKRVYKKDSEGRINIYISDAYNEWTLAGSRPKRPLSSVVLDEGVKEHILADTKDFMANEKWYADRGIPWRRGYLLHGCPGSGKTSLIHSLAGELNLDIYIISLSKKNLDDSSLNEMISKLPSHSLALIEDIDAAFFRGVTREGDSTNMSGKIPDVASTQEPHIQSVTPASGVTLSGLLGAIDGVAAQEGRLLFATTNKYGALDPALVRPGRLDVHIRFKNSGRVQVAELFRNFFPPIHVGRGVTKNMEVDDSNVNIKNDFGLEVSTRSELGSGLGDEESTLVNSPIATPTGFSLSETNGNFKSPSAIYTTDRGSASHIPKLSQREVNRLAHAFSARVPEGEFSMAAIQGLLMQYKTRPYSVIDEVGNWVADERRKRKEREGSVKEEENTKGSDVMNNKTPVNETIKTEETIQSLNLCIWWPLGMI
ncbi:hypothetical protein EW145_g1783 [Phellinidium pouzarii]|uniref:AAA+ ATPase domain-containing protein n=1 Tax=Phellinidium pouzarii TaxID=167371 RepID=A0A4S4LD73_9AGAM|nr:hypothetical protein EW145_g1783 [Phellinidium pouzarii]